MTTPAVKGGGAVARPIGRCCCGDVRLPTSCQFSLLPLQCTAYYSIPLRQQPDLLHSIVLLRPAITSNYDSHPALTILLEGDLAVEDTFWDSTTLAI